MKYALLIILAIGLFDEVYAQSDISDSVYYEVGKQLPIEKISPVFDFEQKEIAFQGKRKKGLILDFWAQGCLSCVESFPKINALYKQFKDHVDFLLIGLENKKIASIYSKYKRKLHLDLPNAFDSSIFKKLGIREVPRVIFINTEGKIEAIGYSPDLNIENLKNFVNHRPLRLEHFLTGTLAPFDYNKPLFINGNGGDPVSKFLFRSLFTGYIPNVNPIGPACIKRQYCKNQIMICNFPLGMIYDLAYGDTIIHTPQAVDSSSYGKYWLKPILELKDSSLFEYNFEQHKNLFSYNTTVPPARSSSQLLQNCMRADLDHYFGYSVSIENRIMPCWKLVAADLAKKKLISKGGKPQFPEFGESAGFTMVNTPVSALINQIFPYHQLEPPIINETGISGNIDLSINCIMTDWNDIVRSLNKNGLNLVKDSIMMKVIIIRDSSLNPQTWLNDPY